MTTPSYDVGPQEMLADIAHRYIGATESGNNRMGDDPLLRDIFHSDTYRRGGAEAGPTDGYPWCASLVSVCIQRLIRQNPRFGHIRPPTVASVNAYRGWWSRSQNCVTLTADNARYSPHRGDIVIYNFSHMGIVDSVTSSGITAVEGNTNVEGSREGTTCRINSRPMSKVAYFIRLPHQPPP